MLDLSMIEDEIEELETSGSTDYETCEALSCLYAVRDNLRSRIRREEGASAPSSEFLAACVGVAVPDLMAVLDEHMEALRAVYPAEYAAVMSRIRSLHDARQAQDQLDIRDA